MCWIFHQFQQGTHLDGLNTVMRKNGTNKLFQTSNSDLNNLHVQLVSVMHDQYCTVPENIHTHPMEGHWKFEGLGDIKSQIVFI